MSNHTCSTTKKELTQLLRHISVNMNIGSLLVTLGNCILKLVSWVLYPLEFVHPLFKFEQNIAEVEVTNLSFLLNQFSYNRTSTWTGYHKDLVVNPSGFLIVKLFRKIRYKKNRFTLPITEAWKWVISQIRLSAQSSWLWNNSIGRICVHGHDYL